LEHLRSASYYRRQYAQLEILNRGARDELVGGLDRIMKGSDSLPVKVGALLTWTQMLGAREGHDSIVPLAKAPELREYVLRAATDRIGHAKSVKTEWLAGFL